MSTRRLALLCTGTVILAIGIWMSGFVTGQHNGPEAARPAPVAAPSPDPSPEDTPTTTPYTGPAVVETPDKTWSGTPDYMCAQPGPIDALYRANNNGSLGGAWVNTHLDDDHSFHIAWRSSPGLYVTVVYFNTRDKIETRTIPVNATDNQIPAEYRKFMKPGQNFQLMHKFDLDLRKVLPGWNKSENTDFTINVCH